MASSGTPVRANIHFAEKDQALREDVHRLGELVGELVREQGGEALFDLVETARRAAIARREGRPQAYAELQALLAALAPSTARDFIRAFSTYFQMVNMAEKVHRIRRRREYLRDESTPQPFGFLDILQRLKAAGVDLEQVEHVLERVSIEPVFTAHPTEVTRRTLLRKQQRIARHLIDMLDPYMTPQESSAMLGRIRLEMATSWQTEERPEEGVRLRDEAEQVLFFLTDVLYRVMPAFYENLEEALGNVYTQHGRRLRVPPLVRFCSWVGGDMDGDPNVTAKSIRETLARQRSLVLDLYYQECRELARDLSQSESRIEVAEEITTRSKLYAGHFPQASRAAPSRHRSMPYRVFLRLIAARLKATYDDAAFPYESPEELIGDLELIADSLRANKGRNAGLFAVQRLLRRAQTFGFHTATLDIRQNALVHRRVIGEALQEDDWLERTSEERTQRLDEALERRESPVGALSSESRRTLAVFQTIAHARRKYGAESIGPYVVSMAHGPDDVLSVLLLARWGHLGPISVEVPLDVAPLFETEEDLANASAIIERLAGDERYRRHLKGRGDHQIVMVGYSDSNKDGGLMASRWTLHRAQLSLVETMRRLGIRLTLFHGRGGTLSRGGGSAYEAVLAAPHRAIDGRLRMIEQGEMINEKYGLRGIAMRTLEQTLAAVMLTTACPEPPHPSEPRWFEMMTLMADTSREAYKRLVHDSNDFLAYFRAATPIDVLERLGIHAEVADGEAPKTIEDLRAMPWVFAWTQARFLLPGWFGAAAGLRHGVERFGADALHDMFRHWRFFRLLVSDVALSLAKADMDVAEHYSRLAGPLHERFFPVIRAEYEHAVELVLQLSGETQLLEESRMVWRAIRLRNPYVDPMSFLQVDLLGRWRKSGRRDDAVLEALLASVNGIAHGMQSGG